jgi:hypothetical protein
MVGRRNFQIHTNFSQLAVRQVTTAEVHPGFQQVWRCFITAFQLFCSRIPTADPTYNRRPNYIIKFTPY